MEVHVKANARWFVLTHIVVGVALVAGCDALPSPDPHSVSPTVLDNGIAMRSATEMFNEATTALENEGAFRVSGTTLVEGEVIKVTYDYSGENRQVRLENWHVRLEGERFNFEFIKLGDVVYFRAPDEMIAHIGGPSNGKFVKVNATDPNLDGFADMTDWKKSLLPPEGTYVKGQRTTVNGRPAIALVHDAGTVYVATVGEPLPLRIEAKTGDIRRLRV
jgi:hypothetical protein